MPKKIHLISFIHAAASSMAYGQWKDTEDKLAREYTDPNFWVKTAQTLERGGFDAIFFADAHGVKDVYRGSYEASVKSGMQFPACDPILVAAAIARETKTIGLIVTWSAGYFPPYHTARLFSTLDHLTNGRAGWNVVTSYLSAGLKNGMGDNIPHDERYDRADEYMDVVYKLWEASWDDDAVQLDAAKGIFTDPTKVRRIKHQGENYQLDAVHLSAPSPQRTPVLYQAGASPKGMGFAAKHAECIFVNGPSRTVLASAVSKARDHIARQGRDPSQVLIFAGMTVIVGRTDKEATDRLHEYRQYVDRDGALTLMSGWTGIDFSTYGKDDRVQHIRNDAIHSAVDRFTIADPNKVWTIGEVAEFVSIGGAGPVVVGSPERVADELVAWMQDTGVDGFNLMYTVMPECFTDFVDLVVPELQRRGVYKTEYAPGSLRQKLIGNGARTSLPHPSAVFRSQARDIATS